LADDTAMNDLVVTTNSIPVVMAPSAAPAAISDWSQHYGDKHRMRRISHWPAGIRPPRKVRVYFRGDHLLLQWWEPTQRKNVAERIDGDLVAALARAREIEERLMDTRNSGQVSRRLRHRELVECYLQDLRQRCDAGEVQPSTVSRYAAALAYYCKFTDQSEIQRRFPYAVKSDRQFALALATFLKDLYISPNGKRGSATRPMQSHEFAWDAVRTVYHWASDPERGKCLPEYFRNPFHRRDRRSQPTRDPIGEPDITVEMALKLLKACDFYQLRLFVPLLFFGLRAEEPVYLFHEYVEGSWLKVPCNPLLAYTTKGKRDKRLPLIEPVKWLLESNGKNHGLLYCRRHVLNCREAPVLPDVSLAGLQAELESRLRAENTTSAVRRHQIRDQLLHEAGGIDYDRIEGEFRMIAGALLWPKTATLKDLRHLFLTMLSNAGLSEPYRQYLTGHALSDVPVMRYTHLNQVREQYLQALERQWPALLDSLKSRVAELQKTVA
jgi:integrase